MSTGKKYLSVIAYLLLFCMLPGLTGCGSSPKAYVSESTTLRDNTPLCLVPSADNLAVYDNELVTVDISHTDEGYIMVSYSGTSPLVKLQITSPEYMTYTYDLHSSGFEVFPLSSGDGEYQIGIYENVSGTQYATIFSETVNAVITNTMGPFLYPNQYVKFNEESQVVATAKELAATSHDDLEVIISVYNYVVANITYDHDKAATVQSGYIPDVDNILSIKTGICLDYAAVMASMLRSQRIPTRLEVGYAGEAYHAWISTFVENRGWVNGIIEFDGQNWSLMDPTFAANAGEKQLKSFIGDGSNYVTKYIY